jgi:hypothetical protein
MLERIVTETFTASSNRTESSHGYFRFVFYYVSFICIGANGFCVESVLMQQVGGKRPACHKKKQILLACLANERT